MRFLFFWVMLCLFGPPGFLHAKSVHVERVEGAVLYGAGDAIPAVPVLRGQDLGPGTFSAGGNGVLYLSAFPNSDLRLGETGTLRFLPEGLPANSARASFRLQQGKLMVTVRDQGHPPNSYRVVFDRGSALMGVGQCVLCMHGEGTYVYVARGRVRLLGESANAGPAQMLTADGSIGVLEKDGTMRVRPLSAVSPATQNCLLAGLQPDASGSGFGHGNHVDASGAPIVSPTQ